MPVSRPPSGRPAPDFLPTYLSNGVVGLRVREISLLNGAAVLNGFAAEHADLHVECTPHAPYPCILFSVDVALVHRFRDTARDSVESGSRAAQQIESVKYIRPALGGCVENRRRFGLMSHGRSHGASRALSPGRRADSG